jgi:hypothetical protein
MAASTRLTASERALRAQFAAHARWSRENPGAGNGEAGQAGLVAKFEREARQADPDASDREIARRGQSALRAHMARLAFESSKARRAARAAGTA